MGDMIVYGQPQEAPDVAAEFDRVQMRRWVKANELQAIEVAAEMPNRTSSTAPTGKSDPAFPVPKRS